MPTGFKMRRIRAAQDKDPADWIVAGLTTFGSTVVGLVPDRFPAYVRVLHPAYRLDPESAEAWPDQPVSWAEIAAANGTTPHAGMQLPAITGSYRYLHKPQSGVYDRPPLEGSLPSELVSSLVELLGRHTQTPESCWFAIWNGFGSMPEHVRHAPLFNVPARAYLLFHGPIDAARENVLGWQQSPNIWWPDDRAWCVATEIDLNSTYIGCRNDCRDDLLASPLEVFQIDASTGISWNSDSVNPEPSRG
jgi:hypothetical protein